LAWDAKVIHRCADDEDVGAKKLAEHIAATLICNPDRSFRCIRRPDGREEPWQDAAILIQLRNEITHYKSQWGQEMERKNLIKSLRELRLERGPFIPANTNFLLINAKCRMRRLV
jgi:hypothetical protein